MTLKQKSQQVHTFIHLNSTSTEEPICNAGDIRDAGSIPGLRRFSRRGHGNPLQYSCLENPMDRGTWQATVYKATGLQRVGHDWSDLAHTQGISTWCLTNINPGTPKVRLHVPLPSSCPCSQHTEPASLHASHASNCPAFSSQSPQHSALLLGLSPTPVWASSYLFSSCSLRFHFIHHRPAKALDSKASKTVLNVCCGVIL